MVKFKINLKQYLKSLETVYVIIKTTRLVLKNDNKSNA
jgi:hypothetical protein